MSLNSLVAFLFLLGAAGCTTPVEHRVDDTFQIRAASFEPLANMERVESEALQRELYLDSEKIIDARHVTSADVVYLSEGQIGLNLKLTEEGAKRIAFATENNIGRPLAILIEGTVVSAPIVRERIDGGGLTISGDFTFSELDALAKRIAPN